eukprot:12912404-Prorocentrum_lima.AAC.1
MEPFRTVIGVDVFCSAEVFTELWEEAEQQAECVRGKDLSAVAHGIGPEGARSAASSTRSAS